MHLALLLFGCAGDGTLKTGDDTSAETGDPWWIEDIDPDAEPEIESGTAWCEGGSDSSGDLFFVEVRVNDDNGNETLTASRVIMRSGNSEVFDEPILVCDGGPYCQGSWRSVDYGEISCSQGSSYDYFAVIMDRDGNESPEYALIWN